MDGDDGRRRAEGRAVSEHAGCAMRHGDHSSHNFYTAHYNAQWCDGLSLRCVLWLR
jgi:hypothetical protein